MTQLHQLKNTHLKRKRIKLLGRGVGSKRGKTSGRGVKGDGSRSGYRRRYGYEGGGIPLYRRLPCRGFTRGRFIKEAFSINLSRIDAIFMDGEVINPQTLREKKLIPHRVPGGIRILGKGEITKKVSIEAHHFTQGAIEKLQKQKISYKLIGR